MACPREGASRVLPGNSAAGLVPSDSSGFSFVSVFPASPAFLRLCWKAGAVREMTLFLQSGIALFKRP